MDERLRENIDDYERPRKRGRCYMRARQRDDEDEGRGIPRGEAVSPLERWQAVLACKLTGASKAVLFAVACRDGGKAGCTASVARLSADSGVSPNSTRRALHAMAEAGLLACSAPEYGAKVYRVQWDALAAYEPPVKAAPTTPTVVAPLPQRDPSHSGTPTTEVAPHSQSGSPPLPQWEPNKETNQEENQEVLLSTSAGAERDTESETLTAVWGRIQARRSVHLKGTRGQAFTPSRRANLAARLKELLRAGLTPDDLVNAVDWVFTSPSSNADGARKGDAVGTLLRPKHCVAYVEKSLEERGGVAPATTRGGADLAWQHITTMVSRGDLADRMKSGRLGPDPDEHDRRLGAIRASGGFPAFRMMDVYTERKIREAFHAAYAGGAV